VLQKDRLHLFLNQGCTVNIETPGQDNHGSTINLGYFKDH